MCAQATTTAMPPVEAVLSEVVASLALTAHAYLEPAASEGAKPDLEGAEVAIDVAGKAFDRIQSRLSSEERSALARLLTELRMTYVRKRGA